MKVLLITLDTYGGIIHYTSQLANALANKLEIVVIAPIGVDKHYFNDNVKIIQMTMGFTKDLHILSRSIKFIKTIYDENPDIIHCNFCYHWLALLLLLFNKFPIITTIHDTHAHLGKFKLIDLSAKAIHIKLSNSVIVHGIRSQNELGNGVKSFIIPHGDYSFFLKYKQNDVEEEDNTILFFGRIVDYKGLDYLISAVNKLSEIIPDIKLIIAGKGDMRKYEKLIINKKHFEIHNSYILDDVVPRLFQRAAIVALPYIEATQTGIIPIAYAFKKPVIVTDTGDMPEVVDDGINGIIVPPRDVNMLAEAIKTLLGNKTLRKEMGEQAHKKMISDLSWDDIALKTIDVYNYVIDTRLRNRGFGSA